MALEVRMHGLGTSINGIDINAIINIASCRESWDVLPNYPHIGSAPVWFCW